MIYFRVLLVLIATSLFLYTVLVIANSGLGLIPIFFGDIAKITWPGQFNLDFTFMLILAMAWVAWRNQFTAIGLVLTALVPIGGSTFLSIYLLILTIQTRGDMSRLLMGKRVAKT